MPIANPGIVTKLNKLLASERAAIIQYGAHEAKALFAGYVKLACLIAARGKAEYEHTEELQKRILEMGGGIEPTVGEVKIAEEFDIEAFLNNDMKAEEEAVEDYAKACKSAVEAGDFLSFNLLTHILGEEREHMRVIQAEKLKIDQMGLDNYLGSLV
jgi:bacterioferritin (cytochrome b1)